MKIATVLVMLILFSMASCFVFAAKGDEAAVTRGATGQYTASPTTPGQVVTQGGNVTNVNLATNSSTIKWQGFYGNVTGNLFLGLGTNVLYNFGRAPVIAVYASRDQNFDFTNLQVTTAAQVDTTFGFTTATDIDQAVDIYTETLTIDGVNNQISTSLADGNFDSFAADDGNNAAVGDFAFGSPVVNAGAVGFNSQKWQYELLVPINAGTPTYYFFMSI